MKQQAARMIFGMMAVAILITAISGTLLPLVIVAAVGYVTWAAAKGLDG
jgi:hypothetical protein